MSGPTSPTIISRVGTTVSRAGSLGMSAASGIDGIWNNNSLQNAIQLMENLSDLGRTVPFIAPAFVLLSLIIQIEKKAHDADAKCSDLLDRVTFMMSHLAVLKKVKVMHATKQVVERMNNILRDSASLIQAYRKQSKIARRINISNRDKFASHVKNVNICTSDLMMSLQIQQSSQLDVLTRGIPVDAEDMAAETFVASHGGIEKVKHDETLVSEFAKELHLATEGDVMEQVNVDIADLMKENQVKLEAMMKDNIGAGVAMAIKELSAQLTEREKEQVFTCVQCEMPYRNSSNGPVSCNFHKAEYDSWKRSYPCCGDRSGRTCQTGTHRSDWHCDYPYGPFFPRAQKINNYVDTVTKWAELEDKHLEKNAHQKAYVGRLLRWVSRSDLLQEQTMIICIGRVWYTEKYYFNTFTAKDLKDINEVVKITGNTLIYRNSPEDEELSMAEWALNAEGTIVGVKITVKAGTSDGPSSKMVPIDIAKCDKSGEVVVASSGGKNAFKPATPYVLPKTIRVGPELSHKPIRATRLDFKTKTTGSLPMVLRASQDPPLKPNPNLGSFNLDYFEGVISLFNKSSVASQNSITIASAKAYYRFVGDEEYNPAEGLELRWELPVTIDPRQSLNLGFNVQVPRTEEDKKLQQRWFNRAFCARKRPVRVKFVFEDMEGEECSLVMEHVFNPLWEFDKKKDEDIDFFFIDDPELYWRYSVHVEPADRKDDVIKIGGDGLDVARLQKIVHAARKSGETEVDLGLGGEKQDGAWEWKAYALVDLSCNRVYAFKIIIQQGKMFPTKTLGCLGYVLCPDYGDITDETREPKYADEKAELYKFSEDPVEVLATNDSYDDFVPEAPRSANSTTSAFANTLLPPSPGGQTMAQMGVPAEVTARLVSIDNNLSRVATALEKLVGHLAKQGNGAV